MITAMRTAAVSAIATKYLALKTDVLSVLGSGVQAKAHIEAFCKVFPIKKVRLELENSIQKVIFTLICRFTSGTIDQLGLKNWPNM